jgi:hypothetical protein
MRKLLVLSVCLLGCARGNPDDLNAAAPGPPSAAFVRIGGAATLDNGLAAMQKELAEAVRDQGRFNERLTQAEAISDRLLETKLPFAWLRTSSYGVEPRVRQIQALADRILAQLRGGMSTQAVLPDVRLLQSSVEQLRNGLRAGGRPAPASLDALLAAYAADTLAAGSDSGGSEILGSRVVLRLTGPAPLWDGRAPIDRFAFLSSKSRFVPFVLAPRPAVA